MYKIIISTTQGQFVKEINDMTELSSILKQYENIYTGVQAIYEPGEVVKEPEEKKPEPQYNTQVKITNFNVNWKNIKSACMTTISKEAGDKEPSHEWKRKLLLCEHSPIRRGVVSWK
jgi:hypothetical protein